RDAQAPLGCRSVDPIAVTRRHDVAGTRRESDSMSQPGLARRVATLVAVAAAYYAAGKLGLSLAFVNASASAVWPPTGIALAALLIFGNSVWPGLLLGAFLVNFTTAGTFLTSIGIAGGNTLEGLIGAYLVRRYA